MLNPRDRSKNHEKFALVITRGHKTDSPFVQCHYTFFHPLHSPAEKSSFLETSTNSPAFTGVEKVQYGDSRSKHSADGKAVSDTITSLEMTLPWRWSRVPRTGGIPVARAIPGGMDRIVVATLAGLGRQDVFVLPRRRLRPEAQQHLMSDQCIYRINDRSSEKKRTYHER
jgi:hypothetical protein